MILHGNLLSTQILFACNGEPSARFNCGIISHNHTERILYEANLNHHTAGRTSAVLGVHIFSCKGSDFKSGFRVIK